MAMQPPQPRRRLCQLLLLAGATLLAGGCGEPAATGATPEVRTVATTTAPGEVPDDLQGVARQAERAGCELELPPVLEGMHVESLDDVDFTSDPPSSGPHFENWAWFGFYTERVHDGYALHNLEHGGVVVWYGPDAPRQSVALLRNDLLDPLEKWLVAPRRGVDGITSAAWGVLLRCDAHALRSMGRASFTSLLEAWYDAVASRGSDAEGQLRAIPPVGETESFDPPLPQPARDISERPLY